MNLKDLEASNYVMFSDSDQRAQEGQIVRMGRNSCTIRTLDKPRGTKHAVVKYENIYRVIDMPFEPETFRACIQELQEI